MLPCPPTLQTSCIQTVYHTILKYCTSVGKYDTWTWIWTTHLYRWFRHAMNKCITTPNIYSSQSLWDTLETHREAYAIMVVGDVLLSNMGQAISNHHAISFATILCRLISEMHQRDFNTLRSRQNGRHFADDTFKWIFLYENVWISIEIPLKIVPKAPINNILALVNIMAWRRPGDKPLSEPMMVRLPTHICVSRPQWVKTPWLLFCQLIAQHC